LRYREDILYKKVYTKKKVCDIHNKIGKIVKKLLKKQDGTLIEDLPTLKKSLKQIEK